MILSWHGLNAQELVPSRPGLEEAARADIPEPLPCFLRPFSHNVTLKLWHSCSPARFWPLCVTKNLSVSCLRMIFTSRSTFIPSHAKMP